MSGGEALHEQQVFLLRSGQAEQRAIGQAVNAVCAAVLGVWLIFLIQLQATASAVASLFCCYKQSRPLHLGQGQQQATGQAASAVPTNIALMG